MYNFKYDRRQSYEINFESWKVMNDEERQSFGERLYSSEESKRIFYSMYGKLKGESDVDASKNV